MKIIKDDIFNYLGKVDAICITTNAMLRTNGNAICGKGIALEASKRWPKFEELLGLDIRENGSRTCHVLDSANTAILSLPTKKHWKNPSKLEIINRSCQQLIQIALHNKWSNIALPKPGCSNGGLNWGLEVKPALDKILDNRFIVIDMK